MSHPSAPRGQRIGTEQRTIAAMLDIYCRDHHGPDTGLCQECTRLRDYAWQRLDNCPFQEHKPVCNLCQVHCYSEAMRARVREVMRYAGPRMPLRHPWLALRHLLAKRRPAPALSARKQTPRTDQRRSGS